MTSAEILAAIAADTQLQALADAGDHAAIAAALSVGLTRVASRLISERGVMSQYAGGPLAADALLGKLEAFAASGLPGAGPVRRALKLLATEAGLDIGDATMRAQIEALAAGGVITAEEAQHLLALALVPDPVAAEDVAAALPVTTWTAELLSVGTDGANVVPRVRYIRAADSQEIEESVPGNDLDADALRAWVARRLRLLDARDRALATYADLPAGPIA